MEDGKYMYEGICNMSIVDYELKCVTTGKSYIGKTQNYLKSRTQQYIGDVWKVIESGNKKFGPNWQGTGGFTRADAFAKYFGNLCRECKTSNQVKAKMKKIWFHRYCGRVIESTA